MSSSSNTRAGTAVGEKGKLRAARILDTARQLLAEEGHAALSMRRIARVSGVRLSHVQYYFPSQAELVRALLQRYLAESRLLISERLQAPAPSGQHPFAPAVGEILAQHSAAHDCALFREMWAMASHDSAISAALRDFYGHYQSDVEAALIAAIPGMSSTRASRISVLVVAVFEGLSVVRDSQSRSQPEPQLLLDLCRMIELLATGL